MRRRPSCSRWWWELPRICFSSSCASRPCMRSEWCWRASSHSLLCSRCWASGWRCCRHQHSRRSRRTFARWLWCIWARTGVADYAAALLTELRRHGRVEVAPAHSDAALYHLGNNGLHAEIYRRAMASPGVVVLHDAVLNHFFLGQLSETGYVDEFVYNYGEWNRDLGRELWRARAGSAADER